MFKYYAISGYLPVLWILLSLLMLAADYLTGPVIQFPILYVFPIGLATWYSGPWWGGLLAVILPLGRLLFSTVWNTPWKTMADATVNTSIRIAAFSILVFLIHQVITKSRDVGERRRAEQRLLDQQRQLRILAADVAIAEETERRRIATGLHDDINQMLIVAKLKLTRLAGTPDPTTIRDVSAQIESSLDHVLAASQSLVFDLVSPVLQKLGLEAALGDLCERMDKQHAISFRFRTEAAWAPLSNEKEIILFHSVRELLRNAVRHAEAKTVNVTLQRDSESVVIMVEDDGRGFSSDPMLDGLTPSGGFGLFAIHERMKYLGGSIRIGPLSPHGARVELCIPVADEKDAS